MGWTWHEQNLESIQLFHGSGLFQLRDVLVAALDVTHLQRLQTLVVMEPLGKHHQVTGGYVLQTYVLGVGDLSSQVESSGKTAAPAELAGRDSLHSKRKLRRQPSPNRSSSATPELAPNHFYE